MAVFDSPDARLKQTGTGRLRRRNGRTSLRGSLLLSRQGLPTVDEAEQATADVATVRFSPTLRRYRLRQTRRNSERQTWQAVRHRPLAGSGPTELPSNAVATVLAFSLIATALLEGRRRTRPYSNGSTSLQNFNRHLVLAGFASLLSRHGLRWGNGRQWKWTRPYLNGRTRQPRWGTELPEQAPQTCLAERQSPLSFVGVCFSLDRIERDSRASGRGATALRQTRNVAAVRLERQTRLCHGSLC